MGLCIIHKKETSVYLKSPREGHENTILSFYSASTFLLAILPKTTVHKTRNFSQKNKNLGENHFCNCCFCSELNIKSNSVTLAIKANIYWIIWFEFQLISHFLSGNRTKTNFNKI